MEISKIKSVIKCDECKIPKGWGYEIIIINNEKYCAKV